MKLCDTKNQLDRYGLLPRFLYESNRVDQLRQLTAYYQVKEKKTDIEIVPLDLVDSYITVPDLSLLNTMFSCGHRLNLIENIRRCFLFFFKDVTYKDEGSFYSLVYKANTYHVQTNVVKSFFYWHVYNDITEAIKIERDDESGSVRQANLIPARKSGSDGQMKIMVDAVLTIDDVGRTEDLDILIVGSSHDPAIIPRLSYDPLFYMVTKSRFYLYDIIEEAGVLEINTNIVTRYRQAFTYLDMKNYDVIIDDSWFQGKTSAHILMHNKLMDNFPLHYSIKSFEEYPLVNVYHQVGHTYSNEVRLVSRSVIPDFRYDSRLGRCCFCLELQFFLQHTYGDSFYKSVHRLHKGERCTPAQWYRELHSFDKGKRRFCPNWARLDPSEYIVTNEIFQINSEVLPLRRPIHCNLPNINVVELRPDLLKLVALVVDSQEVIIEDFKLSPSLYYYSGEGLYHHRPYNIIPTEEVRDFVREDAVKQRNEIAENHAAQKQIFITKIVRELNTVSSECPPVDLPQDIMVNGAKHRKERYRKKEDEVLSHL